MKIAIVQLSDIVKNGFNLSAKDMIAYKEKQLKGQKEKNKKR
jgi:hypothetical protein